MKVEIKSRWDGSVLFSLEAENIKQCLEAAAKAGANLAEANLADTNLAGANLAGAKLAGANLAGAKLADANLADAKLTCTNLTCANLAYANLAGANLAGAYLDNTNLAGAYLAYANLARANLAGAYLAGANLANAKLAGAKLAGAKLKDGSVVLGSNRAMLCIGQLGSRNSYLAAFLTDKGVRLQTGCFFGSMEYFEEKLQEVHGNDQYAAEYRAALTFIGAVMLRGKGVKNGGNAADQRSLHPRC